jgi:tetratricopeptide (TPR) repeat protein
VDAADRELIEDAMGEQRYPGVRLHNVTIRRVPPSGPAEADTALLPPSDPGFGYAWYWLGRALEHRACSTCNSVARDAFAKRFELGGGDRGDLWYASYRLGALAVQLEEAVPILLDAYNRDPGRREPLALLARRYREADKPELCVLFALAALSIPFPGGIGPAAGPHLELHVYEWSVADDAALCLTALGQHERAAALYGQILAHPAHVTLSADQRARMEKNLAWLKEQQQPRSQ